MVRPRRPATPLLLKAVLPAEQREALARAADTLAVTSAQRANFLRWAERVRLGAHYLDLLLGAEVELDAVSRGGEPKFMLPAGTRRMNPRVALQLAIDGAEVDLSEVESTYRPVVEAVLRRNGASPPEALEEFRLRAPNGSAILMALFAIDSEAAQWPHAEVGSRDARGLLWRTAAKISAYEPETPAWVLRPYLARGWITEVEGKIKIGKTTLVAMMVNAILTGCPFLGQPTAYAPVIWLTEERTPTFRSALARARILDHDDLHVLAYAETRELRFDDVVDAAIEKAAATDAGLLVVDTIPTFAEIAGDGENNAGEALRAMQAVAKAAEAGLAVLGSRHGRKAGGEIGDSARGSSAWGGAADILLSLRWPDGQGHDSRRSLQAIGRFDGIPSNLVIELNDAGEYVVLGEAGNVEAASVRSELLDFLPDDQEHALLVEDILEHLRNLGIGSRGTFQRVFKELEADGRRDAHQGLRKDQAGVRLLAAPEGALNDVPIYR